MPCQNVHQIYGPTMAHAWWCWQPRSVCQNDLLVCPLINYSLEAAGRLAGSSLPGRPGRHQLLGLFSWNAPGCCWYLLLNSWPIWNRYRPRFFDQVGHQTTSASMVNKHFFTKSCHHQTYQNYEQSRQKLGTFLENKVL